MSPRRVWQLCVLMVICMCLCSFLLQDILLRSIKSPRICFRGRNHEIYREHVAYLHSIFLGLVRPKQNNLMTTIPASICKQHPNFRSTFIASDDELLVISKSSVDIRSGVIFCWYTYFNFVFLGAGKWGGHCTVLHCTSWCCKLIKINFGMTVILDYRRLSTDSQRIWVTCLATTSPVNLSACEMKFTPVLS